MSGMDDALAEQIFSEPAVHDALHQLAAETLLPRAAALAAQSGKAEFAGSLRVEDGVRPRGRPYSRVIADFDGAAKTEFGDSKNARYRILGRAAGITMWPDMKG